VSDVRAPQVVAQAPPLAAEIRCNSLGLSGNVLAVAHPTTRTGVPHAGLRVYEVCRAEDPKELSFFDTSGPPSRGVHFVWFVDGNYAYLATGARDFTPTHPNDDQFFMVLYMRDPRRPREVSRWWMPGTRQGDSEPLPARRPINGEFRLHSPYDLEGLCRTGGRFRAHNIHVN
jgi:hypothetical protein